MDAVRRKVMVVAIVIALLSMAVVGVMNMPVAAKNNEINMIAQVNQNGSAIVFTKEYYEVKDQYFSIDPTTNLAVATTTQANNWEGKIIGTPNVSSIQHTMMQSFVKNVLKKDFAQYQENSTNNSNGTVYYQAGLTSLDKWNDFKKTHKDNFLGLIIWEYVVSQINELGDGKTVIKSENLDDGHACCVIAASNEFIKNNTDLTIRFLKGYINGVKEVQKLCSGGVVDPTFLEWASEYVANGTWGQLSDTEKQQYRTITSSALLNVKYTYGNEDDPLGALRKDVEKFITSSDELTKKVSNLGYNSPSEYANEIVDDSSLIKALDEKTEVDISSRTIAITTISGDIHQIALHWANHKEYFKAYHITLNIANGRDGSAVATSLQNGEANIGLMGVPPITMVTINSKLNLPVFFEITGKAVDKDGKAIANKEVVFKPSNNQEYKVNTDANGNFTIKVIKGTYTSSDGNFISIDGKDVSIKKIDRIVANYDLGELKVT